MRRALFASVALGCVAVFSFTAAEENQPIPGIGPVGEIVKLHASFLFTEGPAVDRQGNVYFTDVRASKILKVDPQGKLTTFMEDTERCNGLMFDAKGRLIACQGGTGKVIAIDIATKNITVLADEYQGKRFNSPNDLVIDRQGGVYFTDPSFGSTITQDKMAVYYIAKNGQVTRLIDNLPRPNGILLSPDEQTLIVLPSGTPNVMAYPIQAPGKLGAAKVLCKLTPPEQGQARGGDGLTVDTKGNFYLTSPARSGIEVVSPTGKLLGFIKFPEGPANCVFGGKDMKTLYVTARTSLYTVKMEATGHRFGGS